MAKKKALFEISGMHCASCSRIIEGELKKNKGINEASVSYANEQALIEYDETLVSPDKLKSIIDGLGYVAKSAGSKDDDHGDKHDHSPYSMRAMITRLSVSGFCTILLIIGSMVPGVPSFLSNPITMLVLASIIQFLVARSFYNSAWQAFRHGTTNMDTLVVLGTSVAYFYSVILVVLYYVKGIPIGHLYFETSASIITLVVLGSVLEKRAKQKTSLAISSLLKLQAKKATVRKNDQWIEVDLKDIKEGDILRIKPGDTIPVDGIIMSGESSINESMVTGESMPVAKKVDDKVIGSTVNESGSFEMKASQVGEQTMLAKIVQRVRQAQSSKAPVQKIVDSISSVFIPIVIAASLITFVLWLWLGPEPKLIHALTSMVAVLVIACPCAMGLAAPMSIMVGMGRGAKEGLLVRDAEVLERAGKITTVILDKTGTITAGKQRVAHFETMKDLEKQAEQQGWKIPKGKDALWYLQSLILSVEDLSNHPVSKAVVLFFKEKAGELKVDKFETIPGLGITALVGDFKILIGSSRLMDREKVVLSKHLLECSQKWSEMARTSSYVAINGDAVAAFCVADEIRPGAKEVIDSLKRLNITPIMLTGDNERTAKAVAKQVGITNVAAQVMPEEKEERVRSLKKKGEIVAMVGDGINDAPALAAADIGIAMSGGTDVAIETAGISLLRSDIALLPKVIYLSRTTVRNIKQNLGWAFGYNIILIPVAMGVLYPWWGITLHPMLAGAAMAFSSLSVVLNALRLNVSELSATKFTLW